MKNITTLIAFVLLFLLGRVQADIAIIAPFSDESCDQYFDSKALLQNPAWAENDRTSLITLMVNFVAKKVAASSGQFKFLNVKDDNTRFNNLNCFPVPKVIMAENGFNREYAFLLNLKMADLASTPSLTTENKSMCCYVSFPLKPQPITA